MGQKSNVKAEECFSTASGTLTLNEAQVGPQEEPGQEQLQDDDGNRTGPMSDVQKLCTRKNTVELSEENAIEVEDEGGVEGCMENGGALSQMESLRLSATQAYYSISKALRLEKVKSLFQKAEISMDTSVWLVGKEYGSTSEAPDPELGRSLAEQQKVMSDLLLHFQSIPYMTYRKNFAPLELNNGEGKSFTNDAGWGCTLRVSQMLVALTIQRASLGSDWRLEMHKIDESNSHMIQILRMFLDSERAPLSLHSLCHHGSKHGYVSPMSTSVSSPQAYRT